MNYISVPAPEKPALAANYAPEVRRPQPVAKCSNYAGSPPSSAEGPASAFTNSVPEPSQRPQPVSARANSAIQAPAVKAAAAASNYAGHRDHEPTPVAAPQPPAPVLGWKESVESRLDELTVRLGRLA